MLRAPTMLPTPVTVQPVQFLVLAHGKTDADRARARGHLFENFVLRLLAAEGCDEPRREHLQQTANGIEIDVRTRLRVNGQALIAECKAYRANVDASEVMKFYAKLVAERQDTSEAVVGWFVAIPGLTAPGQEWATKRCEKDSNFRVLSSTDLYEIIVRHGWISRADPGAPLVSDACVVISDDGIFRAEKSLDPKSRLASAVRVHPHPGTFVVPDSVLTLLQGSDYADGRPVYAATAAVSHGAVSSERPPLLVTVVGARTDIEYQLPASPRVFVGRDDLLAQLKRTVAGDAADARVIVINAQSGWGKSSLALRLAALVDRAGGHALVLDTRTAATTSYVSTAIREVLVGAEKAGVLRLPSDAAFGSLHSSVATMRSVTMLRAAPLLLFFDQFENVFRNAELTAEFRNLALAVREVEPPVFVGFAWKTDLVTWTEGYPYRLRDDIRSNAQNFIVRPFGSEEVGTLLSRIAKESGTTLSSDLRQRLREYSQGLPWLVKKLASHLVNEIRRGVTEDELLDEAMNVQVLFERERAGLQPREREALHLIARNAPVRVTEITEQVAPDIIQSLVDQRLVVHVGESFLDIYWDVFRDFLNTGRVAIEDTYLMRQRPASAARLLRVVVERGGAVSVADAASALSTTDPTVWNAAKELRQLGVLLGATGQVRLVESLQRHPPERLEDAVRERVAVALRRHRILSLISEDIELDGGATSIERVAELLVEAFPAVSAKNDTWVAYANAFTEWCSYAGLLERRGEEVVPAEHKSEVRLLAPPGRWRQKHSTFPQTGPAPTLAYARFLVGLASGHELTSRAVTRALSNLRALGLVDETGAAARGSRIEHLFDERGVLDKVVLTQLLEGIGGGRDAIQRLRAEPDVPDLTLGTYLADGQGGVWGTETRKYAGKAFRAWARFGGIGPAKKPRVVTSPRATRRGG